MNRNGNSILVLALSMALAEGAMAQDKPTTPAPEQTTAAPASDKPTPQEDFEARKKNALSRVAINIEKLQSLQTCIQAAADSVQLGACRPVRMQRKPTPH